VTILLAALGVVVGAALQSATGFGFALVAAPILFAVVGPQPAVGALIVVGTFTSVLTIATEGRRPRPLRRETTLLLTWAIPGALAGVAVLRALSAEVLQIALTVGVLAVLGLRHTTRRTTERPPPPWGGPVAGLAAGGLTTATGTAGPPLVTFLLGRGHSPGAVRDTLATCFLGLNVIGAAALVVTATTGAVPDLSLLAAIVPATLIGQLAGRPLFARLAHGGSYEPVLTGVLLLSITAGLIGTFTS
jgi:uncharacterized protein